MYSIQSTFNSNDSELAKNYISNPDTYVRVHSVKINGKLRNLRAYKDSPNGAALRLLHQKIAEFISSCYTSAESSFAYKKGCNILSCIKQHERSSTFLKSDIRAYFDSISYEKMWNKLKEISVFQENNELLSTILQACFYEDKLPLGFCSSPVLSDFYLTELDRKFEILPDVIYTRYADDFIISSTACNAEKILKQTREALWDEIENFGLDLNEKKTYIRALKTTGDSFHALGLNLVFIDKNKNRITVSDGYLRETCKLLAQYTQPNVEEEIPKNVILGKINFIREASQESYQKFKKLVKIKLNKDLETFFS
jgi:hypothetical protein